MRLMNKMACVGLLASALTLTGCGGEVSSVSSSESKTAFDFVYNVNYEGGSNRTVTIKKDQKASYWNAKRTGYELQNWFTTKDLDTAYDFNTSVTADTTIYAAWKIVENKEPVIVSFDYNYEGSPMAAQVTGYKGKTLEASLAPDPKRLGYSVEGWYLEKTLLTKFVFGSDLLQDDLTLYAKYTSSAAFNRDEEGNIIYDGVALNLAVNDNWCIGGEGSVSSLVKAFNIKYRGQIAITVVDNSVTDNSLVDVKLHQSNVVNRSGDYYSMADVLNLAGLSFDATDYYADQIADCYINGVLKTYPLGSYVPELVYNKALMAKAYPAYAVDGTLPSTYEEFQTAMKGAIAENKLAIVAGNGWDWMENASNLCWSQNDAMMYDFDKETGKYDTDWSTEAGAARALTAAKSMYEMFNPHSEIGAHSSLGDSWANETWDKVKTGDSLFALPSIISRVNASYDSATTGLMPVTNLFNLSGTGDTKNFVGNYSIGVTSHESDDLYKIAAAGVFSDFLAKNWKNIGDTGLYPASKTIQAGSFASSTSHYATMIREAGDPSLFVTLPGHSAEYTIFNDDKSANISYINSLDSWVEKDMIDYVASVADSVKGMVE